MSKFSHTRTHAASFVASTFLLLAAGCFTISETPVPTFTARVDPVAATNITLAVRGFDTTLTDYVLLDGYHTVFYDRGPYWCNGITTAHTTTVVPQAHASDMFLELARDQLERIGFNVMAPTPDYLVEARFAGPHAASGDTAASAAWFICSLLTCSHGAQTWTAHLKIRDNRTGRLLLAKDFEQRYEVTGFSPIPLFGISFYERSSSNNMQCWCLRMLTERIASETAAFLTARK